MDPITILGAAGSAIGIAGFGIQLAQVLSHYVSEVHSAAGTLRAILENIESASHSMKQIHGFLEIEYANVGKGRNANLFTPEAIEDIQATTDKCLLVFWRVEALVMEKNDSQELEAILSDRLGRFKRQLKAAPDSPVPILELDKPFAKARKLSVRDRLLWPLQVPKLEQYNKRLHTLQASLTLMFQVLTIGALQRKPGIGIVEMQSINHIYAMVPQIAADADIYSMQGEYFMRRRQYPEHHGARTLDHDSFDSTHPSLRFGSIERHPYHERGFQDENMIRYSRNSSTNHQGDFAFTAAHRLPPRTVAREHNNSRSSLKRQPQNSDAASRDYTGTVDNAQKYISRKNAKVVNDTNGEIPNGYSNIATHFEPTSLQNGIIGAGVVTDPETSSMVAQKSTISVENDEFRTTSQPKSMADTSETAKMNRSCSEKEERQGDIPLANGLNVNQYLVHSFSTAHDRKFELEDDHSVLFSNMEQRNPNTLGISPNAIPLLDAHIKFNTQQTSSASNSIASDKKKPDQTGEIYPGEKEEYLLDTELPPLGLSDPLKISTGHKLNQYDDREEFTTAQKLGDTMLKPGNNHLNHMAENIQLSEDREALEHKALVQTVEFEDGRQEELINTVPNDKIQHQEVLLDESLHSKKTEPEVPSSKHPSSLVAVKQSPSLQTGTVTLINDTLGMASTLENFKKFSWPHAAIKSGMRKLFSRDHLTPLDLQQMFSPGSFVTAFLIKDRDQFGIPCPSHFRLRKSQINAIISKGRGADWWKDFCFLDGNEIFSVSQIMNNRNGFRKMLVQLKQIKKVRSPLRLWTRSRKALVAIVINEPTGQSEGLMTPPHLQRSWSFQSIDELNYDNATDVAGSLKYAAYSIRPRLDPAPGRDPDWLWAHIERQHYDEAYIIQRIKHLDEMGQSVMEREVTLQMLQREQIGTIVSTTNENDESFWWRLAQVDISYYDSPDDKAVRSITIYLVGAPPNAIPADGLHITGEPDVIHPQDSTPRSPGRKESAVAFNETDSQIRVRLRRRFENQQSSQNSEAISTDSDEFSDTSFSDASSSTYDDAERDSLSDSIASSEYAPRRRYSDYNINRGNSPSRRDKTSRPPWEELPRASRRQYQAADHSSRPNSESTTSHDPRSYSDTARLDRSSTSSHRNSSNSQRHSDHHVPPPHYPSQVGTASSMSLPSRQTIPDRRSRMPYPEYYDGRSFDPYAPPDESEVGKSIVRQLLLKWTPAGEEEMAAQALKNKERMERNSDLNFVDEASSDTFDDPYYRPQIEWEPDTLPNQEDREEYPRYPPSERFHRTRRQSRPRRAPSREPSVARARPQWEREWGQLSESKERPYLNDGESRGRYTKRVPDPPVSDGESEELTPPVSDGESEELPPVSDWESENLPPVSDGESEGLPPIPEEESEDLPTNPVHLAKEESARGQSLPEDNSVVSADEKPKNESQSPSSPEWDSVSKLERRFTLVRDSVPLPQESTELSENTWNEVPPAEQQRPAAATPKLAPVLQNPWGEEGISVEPCDDFLSNLPADSARNEQHGTARSVKSVGRPMYVEDESEGENSEIPMLGMRRSATTTF